MWNQAVTFSATIVPATATGVVTFKDSVTTLAVNVPVIGGVATFIKSNLFTGNHTAITATYSGNACFLAKASANYSQLVYRAPSTISVTTDINPSACGQRFFINLGFGSMGHGTVAPIGAALALPGRPVFALVGDGCFTMNGMDLLTAANHDVSVVWIVENNNMHGITWHCSKILGGGRGFESIRYRRHIEVASIARAMGMHSWVVDAPGKMQEAVREALRRGGPALIEVRIDGTVVPPLGERQQSLAGFIES